MSCSESIRDPRFGFKASVLASSGNLSMTFTDLHHHFTFHSSGATTSAARPRITPLEQILALLEMRDLHVAERLICQCQSRVLFVSHHRLDASPPPSFHCRIQSSGLFADVDERTRVSKLLRHHVLDGQRVCRFRELRSKFHQTERPHHLSRVATSASSIWAIRSPGGHCRPKPVSLSGGFFSCGHTIKLQLPSTPFFASIKSALWSCTSSLGLKCVCKPTRSASATSLYPCRVSSFAVAAHTGNG